ncbi:MAG TPA: hypothetical protein H9863_01465, partial [Candidatus Odoribacter faecigallinarum]|nr:hypothetical protein [Candidatus Odoribacter faecigallinarum]
HTPGMRPNRFGIHSVPAGYWWGGCRTSSKGMSCRHTKKAGASLKGRTGSMGEEGREGRLREAE